MWSMRFVLYVFLTNLTGAFPVTVRFAISENTHKRKYILRRKEVNKSIYVHCVSAYSSNSIHVFNSTEIPTLQFIF